MEGWVLQVSGGIKYRYTLDPYSVHTVSDSEVSEIDLHYSSDFCILFNGLFDQDDEEIRQKQMNRLMFLETHSDIQNFIAHFTRKICTIKSFSVYDMECFKTLQEVIDGEYGEKAELFFKKCVQTNVAEIILWFLVQKRNNNSRNDYFESVLNCIFHDKVFFYFDKIKKILFVSFLDEKTQQNSDIFEICKYLFADLLLHIEVRWRVYPVILDKNNYIIASEGEQLCGTII